MDFGNLKWTSFKRQKIIALIPFGGLFLLLYTQWLFFINRVKIGNKSGIIYTFVFIPVFFGILIIFLLSDQLFNIHEKFFLKIEIALIAVAFYMIAFVAIWYQKYSVKKYLKSKQKSNKKAD